MVNGNVASLTHQQMCTTNIENQTLLHKWPESHELQFSNADYVRVHALQQAGLVSDNAKCIMMLSHPLVSIFTSSNTYKFLSLFVRQ